MTPDLKISLLFSIAFLISVFITLLIVMHSVGSMGNVLDRLHEILQKEVVLRYNSKVYELKQEKQRSIAAVEKQKRQEALLAIPLSRNSSSKKKPK